MNLFTVLNSVIPVKSNVKDTRASLKLLSLFVKDVSSLNKKELYDLADGVNFYKSNRLEDKTRVINFSNGGTMVLDENQALIVTSNPYEHRRIIAGAGSGKTTTVLCRVKYLLDNIICPDNIIILTFNRDSAENIRNRIYDLFGFQIKLSIYTIDAFCEKIINQYGWVNTCSRTTSSTYVNTKIKSISENSTLGYEVMYKYGKEIASQYSHVFFDEFQDVNDVQYGILNLFALHGCFLTVIGDDCQNIYQFRGTNNYYMINFNTLLPCVQTSKLEINYRSNDRIVCMANDSIQWNKDRIDKKMVSYKKIFSKHAHNNNEFVPKIIATCSHEQSYNYIIQKIKDYVKKGMSYDSIAVLSRNSLPLKQIETELTKHEIPHIALITDSSNDSGTRVLVPDKVAVTTIFKSKGLEFDVVFILGVSDTHFPEHINGNIKNIEEERRLFYVGITRSKEHLYFVDSVKNKPFSRFLKEIKTHVEICHVKQVITEEDKKKPFNPANELVFEPTNECLLFEALGEDYKKTDYGVTDLIMGLDSKDFKNMRQNNLIINADYFCNKVFSLKLMWSDEVSDGMFESDIGEYVDRKITYGICKGTGVIFRDFDAEVFILLNVDRFHKQEDKSILGKLFKHSTYMKEMCDSMNIDYRSLNFDDDTTIDIITKYLCYLKRMKIAKENYNYSFKIIRIVALAYLQIVLDQQNIDSQIMSTDEAIYWISLCRKFRNDRNRLAWRNIYNLVSENVLMTSKKGIDIDKIHLLDRILYYTEYFTNSGFNPICKITLIHMFNCAYCLQTETNINDTEAMKKQIEEKRKKNTIRGEIDMIYMNDIEKKTWTIVDFKCSVNDFKLEWMVQLLFYYSLMKKSNEYSKYTVTKIQIINLMDGNEYTYDVDENYDCLGLIKMMENKILSDQCSTRAKPDFDLIIPLSDKSSGNVLMGGTKKLEYHMRKSNVQCTGITTFFDTETSDFDGDILQIAWVLCDDSMNILKQSSYYIKDRISTKKAEAIHGISIDTLRDKGEDFFDVMSEFLDDVGKSDKVVGHNVSFDTRVVTNNLIKYGVAVYGFNGEVLVDPFEYVSIVCTLSLFGKKKLGDIYKGYFGDVMKDAHDALTDTLMLMECYAKYYEELEKNNNNNNMICLR